MPGSRATREKRSKARIRGRGVGDEGEVAQSLLTLLYLEDFSAGIAPPLDKVSWKESFPSVQNALNIQAV